MYVLLTGNYATSATVHYGKRQRGPNCPADCVNSSIIAYTARLNRKLFPTTLTELIAIAALATTGLNEI